MSYTYAQSQMMLLGVPVVLPAVKHGVVYTKPWVVDLILDLAGYTPSTDLGALTAVEPAAGEGSFVVTMVERLIDSCRRHGRDITTCGSALVAFELDPESAKATRAAVLTSLVRRGISETESSTLARQWVHDGDYLLVAPEMPPADFIVGNPPYIRLEDMDAGTAETYRRRYRTMVGRADLYVAFYEAALHGLSPGGVCGFVCADRWMLNQYGAELRRLVTSGFAVEAVIEMHRADAFETEVSAYPAITIIRRSSQGSAVVARAGSGVEQSGGMALADAIREASINGSTVRRLPGLTATKVEGWFEGTAPLALLFARAFGAAQAPRS